MVEDHLRALIAADTVEALWSLHTRKMAEYGFDRLLYGFTYYKTERSFGPMDDLTILSSHSEAYNKGFVNNRMFEDGPMVQWAVEHEGFCSWQRTQDAYASGQLPEKARRVVEFNREMGVVAGYTISFRQISTRSKGAIGLAARLGLSQAEVDEIWAEHGQRIMLMNDILHLKIHNLPSSEARPLLTPRQREALEWVGDGKTMQDIATILGVSQATVEKHLRLARTALGVETTAQAVLKAWFQHQIFRVTRQD
ncbi:helix-turn-helix transcriptional regulator [Rhodovulum adriaticum]|uniref:LuxR family transcriptional regulator n=1 Tax=Rhodovulum adriaticum TaxID=35804 RepID=A0A4R2NTE7_RHOAD|nr:LuxR family transcriptional regulator [Rhodovulum adriaticum]MBK1635092.1 LuxR family transcriptional regulator [Rhodovulum adriaticum]TCP25273.1 LuxR family transcriptional regulator [Rhodovulum adriaticum]